MLWASGCDGYPPDTARKEELYGSNHGHPAATPGPDRGPGRRSRSRSSGRGQRGHAQFGDTVHDDLDDVESLDTGVIDTVIVADAGAFALEDAQVPEHVTLP
jgi:hypothetical protein